MQTNHPNPHQTPAKPTPAEPVPTEQVPTEQAQERQASREQVPGQRASAEQVPGENAPGGNAPGGQASNEQVPGENAPGEQVLGEQVAGAKVPGDQEPGAQVLEEEVEGERSEVLVAAIEQELSALFRRSRSASLRLARRVHPDMDAAGYALISQIELGSGAGVRASDVAQVLGLDKSTVSRGITQLETLGLIERVGDPDDGRARLLRLTATGAERYEAMRTQRQTEFRAILARWNPTDLSDLGRLLTRLNTDLG